MEPWMQKLIQQGFDESTLKAMTETSGLTATIPTIWNPVLERNYLKQVMLRQFAVVNTDLVGTAGDNVKISKVSQIGPAADMDATSPLGIAGLGSQTRWNNTTNGYETAFTTRTLVTLTPSVKFKAVKYTKVALEESFGARMTDAAEALGQSFALKDDSDSFECINFSSNIVWGDGDHVTWATLDPTDAGDLFGSDMLGQAKAAYKVNTRLNAFAFFGNGELVCLIHPLQTEALMGDTDVFDVVKRAAPEKIFKGEVTMWKNIRFVESDSVPFFAAGAITPVAAPANMLPVSGSAPDKQWYFASGGTARTNIVPYYQSTRGHTAGIPDAVVTQDIGLTLDSTDAAAMVVFFDPLMGIVEFDVAVGGTAVPQAVFSYGQYPGFSCPLIGPRAFAKAIKWNPTLTTENTNYGLFTGIGGSASWDTKILNPEQIMRLNSVVVLPQGLMVPNP